MDTKPQHSEPQMTLQTLEPTPTDLGAALETEGVRAQLLAIRAIQWKPRARPPKVDPTEVPPDHREH